MILKKLVTKIKDDLGTREMHNLILKSTEEGLTEEEMKVLNAWINANDYRKDIYKKYLEVEEFQKRVSDAKTGELKVILSEVAKHFPEHNFEIPNNLGFLILRTSLAIDLGQISYRLSRKLVFGKRRILIIAFLTRLLILIIFVLILLAVIKLRNR